MEKQLKKVGLKHIIFNNYVNFKFYLLINYNKN